MPENCYTRVFGVKKFIFDVKTAKIRLRYGEYLSLEFDRAQLPRKKM